jgi:hypothetical protein
MDVWKQARGRVGGSSKNPNRRGQGWSAPRCLVRARGHAMQLTQVVRVPPWPLARVHSKFQMVKIFGPNRNFTYFDQSKYSCLANIYLISSTI